MKLCSDEYCRRLGELIPLDQFTRNRNRDDGRNDYCCECSVRRNRECRERKQERSRARAAVKEEMRSPFALSPAEQVWAVIERGTRTREAIEQETGLDENVVADTLADLWDEDRVVIVKSGDESLFFIKRVAA